MSRRHAARRPAWTCQRCGAPWPCARARQQLLRAVPRRDLPHLLGRALITASRDGLTGDPRTVYGRFVGWLRRRPSPTPR